MRERGREGDNSPHWQWESCILEPNGTKELSGPNYVKLYLIFLSETYIRGCPIFLSVCCIDYYSNNIRLSNLLDCRLRVGGTTDWWTAQKGNRRPFLLFIFVMSTRNIRSSWNHKKKVKIPNVRQFCNGGKIFSYICSLPLLPLNAYFPFSLKIAASLSPFTSALQSIYISNQPRSGEAMNRLLQEPKGLGA